MHFICNCRSYCKGKNLKANHNFPEFGKLGMQLSQLLQR